ncbi:hypothetical protein [Mumia sp. Pv 4-285]|uniref:hypothetical protein n=1 Tax=Mumia qirimensis TaxID=3234852 RepID=UPI00351D8E85
MTNSSNEPSDRGDDQGAKDRNADDAAPEVDQARSSAQQDLRGTGDTSDRGAVVDHEDQDSEPSGNAPAGQAPNDPSGS